MHATDQAMTDAMMAFHEAYAALPTSNIFDEPDCFAYQSDIGFPVFAGVPLQRFRSDAADRRIREVARRFDGTAFTWMILPSSQPSDLKKRLEDAGLEQAVELQGMAMDLLALATPPPTSDGIELTPATSERQVEDYGRVFPELFGAPTDGWIDKVVSAELALFRHDNDPMHRWVAYEDGKAIGAAMTMNMDGVAILQTLCTREEARNRGIGQALATLALEQEARQGSRTAIVWSSPGARSLYHRMGFQDTATAQVFAG